MIKLELSPEEHEEEDGASLRRLSFPECDFIAQENDPTTNNHSLQWVPGMVMRTRTPAVREVYLVRRTMGCS